MKTNPVRLGKLSWGLIVLFVGVILLLDNLAIIDFHWWAIVRFWPVLIILLGVNVLLPKSSEGQILSIMATLATLVFFTFQGLTSIGSNFWFNHRDRPDRKQPGQIEMEQKGQHSSLSREYDSSITRATLNISGGAVEYNIAGTTASLIDVETYSNFSSFSLSSTVKDQSTVLDLSQKSHKKIKLKKLSGNKAQIRLNQAPIWDINVELGAGTADFNLKPFKVNHLKLEGGASSLTIDLGMPAEAESKITFEGGVSSLQIEIPQKAGCRIKVESALSSLDFPGFIKQEDGSYVTENYNDAGKKFNIELDNGLSSIEISRYEQE